MSSYSNKIISDKQRCNITELLTKYVSFDIMEIILEYNNKIRYIVCNNGLENFNDENYEYNKQDKYNGVECNVKYIDIDINDNELNNDEYDTDLWMDDKIFDTNIIMDYEFCIKNDL